MIFLPFDIKGVATVSSARIFNQESISFPKWGEQTFHGVPFLVGDPEGGKTKNVICLYSARGAISSKMPKTVRLPCELPAKEIHFLGGVGWGFPSSNKGTVSMVVKLEYADGSTEEHPLLNGVHLTDWAKGPDVPESKSIGVVQIRYYSIVPKRQDSVIRAVEFLKGTDQTSPFVIAATIEGPASLLAKAAEERDQKRQETEKAERERKEAFAKAQKERQLAAWRELPALPGLDGKNHSLAEYKKDVLVVCVLRNSCPVSAAHTGANGAQPLIDFTKKYGDKVDFVAIYISNTNREDDKLPKIKERALPFPCLYDEKKATARSLGAKVTPHFFVFNKERTLIYEGAMTDNAANPTVFYLDSATEAGLKGVTPKIMRTNATGCPISYPKMKAMAELPDAGPIVKAEKEKSEKREASAITEKDGQSELQVAQKEPAKKNESPTAKEKLWNDLNEKLNKLANWSATAGEWTEDNGLLGKGNSLLHFKDKLPSDFQLTFDMTVIAGCRPRVHFHWNRFWPEQANSLFYLGSEGDGLTLFPYGGGVSQKKGAPTEYRTNEVQHVKVIMQGKKAAFWTNGKVIASATRTDLQHIDLLLSAGDDYSGGPVRFANFKISELKKIDELVAQKPKEGPGKKDERPEGEKVNPQEKLASVDFSKVDYQKGPNGEPLQERKSRGADVLNRPTTEKGFFDKGRFVRHGIRIIWDNDNPMIKEGEDYWFNGQLHGIRTFYYLSGKKVKDIPFVNGKASGTMICWYEDGSKQIEVPRVNGQYHGSYFEWYPNGKLKMESTFVQGIQHGMQREWYDNGVKKYEGEYKKGETDGLVTQWHRNGNKKDECVCWQGWKNGVETIWHENGKVADRLEWHGGKLIGKVAEPNAKAPVKLPEPLKEARKLVAQGKTTSNENIDQDFTQHLQNMSASITAKQIVLEFDVDRKNWQPVTRSFSLVVRLFDKDGKYLTHFVTNESFTASPDVFDGWKTVVNRLNDAPPKVQAEMGGFTPKLLEVKGNRLIYNVNPAFLQNAAIVEVGLIHVKKGPF